MTTQRQHFYRTFILFLSVLLGLVFALSGCTRKSNKKPEMVTEHPEIRQKLDRLLQIREEKGYPMFYAFLPGLTITQINEKTAELPFQLPSELYELYQWRNGTPESSTAPFLIRDQRFLPLEEALQEYTLMNRFYINPVQKIFEGIDLEFCFPFAGFDGSLYVFPAPSHKPIDGLTRPVINVFEGIDVHFNSFELMLDTAIEWYESGIHDQNGVTLSYAEELRIWKKHNPGIFE